jgi:hypothetical protein
VVLPGVQSSEQQSHDVSIHLRFTIQTVAQPQKLRKRIGVEQHADMRGLRVLANRDHPCLKFRKSALDGSY